MLSAYRIDADRLHPVVLSEGPGQAVWIDLFQPSSEEEALVERLLGIDVPTEAEMAEIEASSRLYRENGAVYMTATFVRGVSAGEPESCPITFIMTEDRFVTVRYSEPSVFPAFVARPDLPDLRTDRDRIFAGLLEAIVDRTADISEQVAATMDGLSAAIFRAGDKHAKDLGEVTRKIGRSGDVNSKVRESVVTLGRAVDFFAAECRGENVPLYDRLESISADLRSLGDHSTFLAGKIEFLLEATLGFINIEQNNIMRIMSVAAVVIMPPTLIASTYGMNFRFMPELDWPFGYPLALGLMVASAIVPYLFFRRRGWL